MMNEYLHHTLCKRTICNPILITFTRSRTPQPPAEDEEENIDDSLVTIDTCKCQNSLEYVKIPCPTATCV